MLATAVLMFIVAPVMAQVQGSFGLSQGLVYLLSQKSVQEELKMSKEQVESGTKAIDKQRKALRELPRNLSGEELAKGRREIDEEAEKTIKEILKPEQAMRLRQINLQLRSGGALMTPSVHKELNLTAEQCLKIAQLSAENYDKVRESLRNVCDAEAIVKKMHELNKEFGIKMLELLTAEQKAKWKEMTGKPFTGKIAFAQYRGQ